MTVRLAVYYKQPEDPDTFEKRYIEEHLPIVRTYPNVKVTKFHKLGRLIAGDQPPYAYVFVAAWDDKDGFKADMNSDAAKKAAEHATSLGVPFDVVMLDQLA